MDCSIWWLNIKYLVENCRLKRQEQRKIDKGELRAKLALLF